MGARTRLAVATVLALAGVMTGCGSGGVEGRRSVAEAEIRGWPPSGRLAAASLLEEYGAPDFVRPAELVWSERSPWTRIAVRDSAEIEQTVPFEVPADQRAPLEEFSADIRIRRDGGSFTVRSVSEKLNFLTANLAMEVARGEKSPGEARDSYEKILQLSLSGKASRYLEGLIKPARQKETP